MNDKMRKIIRLIALIALIVSAGVLIFYAVDDLRSKNTGDKLNDLKGAQATSALPDILPEYKALYAENPDTIGWLRIDGTGIDNVVMYAPDEIDKYLHTDFYGKYSYRGCLFVDEYCDILSSDNLIIYGHNMKDYSMFGSLMYYVSEDFYRQHKLISFDTIYEKQTYEIVAAIKTELVPEGSDGFKYYEYTGSGDEASFSEYVKFIEENKLYDTDAELSPGDKILTLSTCAYHSEDGRFIVVARKI